METCKYAKSNDLVNWLQCAAFGEYWLQSQLGGTICIVHAVGFEHPLLYGSIRTLYWVLDSSSLKGGHSLGAEGVCARECAMLNAWSMLLYDYSTVEMRLWVCYLTYHPGNEA